MTPPDTPLDRARALIAREEWRPIAAEPGYEVSSLGRVRGPKGLRKATLSHGYLCVAICHRNYRIHVEVLKAFTGPRPAGMDGAHWNGDRLDARWENLIWQTRRENCMDKWAHGTMRHGTSVAVSKLTEAQVVEIRQRAQRRHPTNNYYALGREFGVSERAIRKIVSGEMWTYLMGEQAA